MHASYTYERSYLSIGFRRLRLAISHKVEKLDVFLHRELLWTNFESSIEHFKGAVHGRVVAHRLEVVAQHFALLGETSLDKGEKLLIRPI